MNSKSINHMARYRRYRRTIVRAPKKKWASNIVNINSSTSPTSSNSQFSVVSLVTNAVQTSSPTPVIVKSGNFKVQGDSYISASSSGTFSVSLYVIYAPEGITINDASSANGVIRSHPEWVMAWKFISSDYLSTSGGTSNSNTFSFSSRMKRNLNSGDSILLICLASGVGLNFFVSIFCHRTHR